MVALPGYRYNGKFERWMPDRGGDRCGHIHSYHAWDFASGPPCRRAVRKPSDAGAGGRVSPGLLEAEISSWMESDLAGVINGVE